MTSGTAPAKSRSRVLGPEEGESYWQPVPANGFVRNLVGAGDVATGGGGGFAVGTQTVAPRAFIREHTHATEHEVIFVVEGRGIARIEGVDHPIERGSCVHVAPGERHHFLNPHDEPMTFLWVFASGGLDAFFAGIGRPRRPGEPAPEPFPRPADVAAIERRTVFGWTDSAYDPEPSR